MRSELGYFAHSRITGLNDDAATLKQAFTLKAPCCPFKQTPQPTNYEIVASGVYIWAIAF